MSDIKPNFSPLALDILRDRYLWRDAEGNITETPEQLLRRVATHVASAEENEADRKKYAEAFYEIMAKLDFLPNSPTLMNAGRPAPHGQLSACFVVGIEDSMESICEALRKQMLIHKSGGGTGFNFSKLRPKGATVNSTNGRASGPVSFMRMFDLATDVVQAGGMRRGANLAILNADHPDIREFIACKDEEGVITNFNLSVGITDDFMEKVLSGDTLERQLLWEIAEHAWKTGDPGMVYLDTINATNPLPALGRIEACNPCSEASLLYNEACNLGSINLSHMVTPHGTFDWGRLRDTAILATRFLDDVIDVNQYPLPEIDAAVKRTRKIGLGVMGWADLLYRLRIPYDSEEAVKLADEIMQHIQALGHIQSGELGWKKGIPADCYHLRRRNATVTCIAPTGTLALLANCSSGIEPIFSNHYTRKVRLQTGEIVEKEMFNDAYMELVNDMTVSDEDVERIAKTAYTVSPEYHLRHTAAFQRYTDLGVSKTINMPADATVEDVFNIYVSAWRQRLKGVTVYRNGSRGSQVLTESALPPVRCTSC